MQLIWEDGNLEELASSSNTIVEHFTIFHKIIHSRIVTVSSMPVSSRFYSSGKKRRRIEEVPENMKLVDDAVSSLKNLCCICEEAFVYTLCLITRLIRYHFGIGNKIVAHRLLWLMEHLEAYAIDVVKVGATVARLHAAIIPRMIMDNTCHEKRMQFVVESRVPLCTIASVIADLIISASDRGTVSVADLRKLSGIYSFNNLDDIVGSSNDVAYVSATLELLRNQEFLTILIHELFSLAGVKAHSSTSTTAREKQQIMRQLLSLAIVDTSSIGSLSELQLNANSVEEKLNASTSVMSALLIEEKLPSNETVTQNALDNITGSVVLLFFLKQLIIKSNKAIEEEAENIIPSLKLVFKISTIHKTLHPIVLDVLTCVLDSSKGDNRSRITKLYCSSTMSAVTEYGDNSTDVIKTRTRYFVDKETLDAMMKLALNGYVERTLHFIEKWIRSATKEQQVLVRKSVEFLLDNVREPYSDWFMRVIDNIISVSGTPKGEGFSRLMKYKTVYNGTIT